MSGVTVFSYTFSFVVLFAFEEIYKNHARERIQAVQAFIDYPLPFQYVIFATQIMSICDLR